MTRPHRLIFVAFLFLALIGAYAGIRFLPPDMPLPLRMLVGGGSLTSAAFALGILFTRDDGLYLVLILSLGLGACGSPTPPVVYSCQPFGYRCGDRQGWFVCCSGLVCSAGRTCLIPESTDMAQPIGGDQ